MPLAQVAQEIIDQATMIGWDVKINGDGHYQLTPQGAAYASMNVKPVIISGSGQPYEGAPLNGLRRKLRDAGFYRELQAYNEEQENKRLAALDADRQRGERALEDAARAAAAQGGFATGPHGMIPSAEWLTVPALRALRARATSDPTFNQRPIRKVDLFRWHSRMRRGKFVHYLPEGALCLDPDGLTMNGLHRITSGIDTETELGVWVFRNVPRSMFPYFDTGRPRTAGDVFHINGRKANPLMESAVRLAWWYDGVLDGRVEPGSWIEWTSTRIDNPELDELYAATEEWAAKKPGRAGFVDCLPPAGLMYSRCRVLAASALVFRHYALRTWPEGELELRRFWDVFTEGGASRGNPAWNLRDWALQCAADRRRINSKREVHLLLLLRAWRQWNEKTRPEKISYTIGQPMPHPYVPK